MVSFLAGERPPQPRDSLSERPERTEQLEGFGGCGFQASNKIVGIVIDMIDEIVHGAMLGKRGIVGQINAWCETGFVEKLFLLLADHGFQIYLTADHGNVDAEGIGRLNQGVVSEPRGERGPNLSQ